MDIQTEKLELIEWITRLKDIPMVEKLNAIKDDYLRNRINPAKISASERESILRGIKDFEEGKTHSHDDARKVYEKYL